MDTVVAKTMPNPDSGLPFTKQEHFAYWEDFFQYQFGLLDNPHRMQPVPYQDWPEDCIWHEVVRLLAGVTCPPKSTDWPEVGTAYFPSDYVQPAPREVTEEERKAAAYEKQLKQYAPPQGRLNSVAETSFSQIVKDTGRMFMFQAAYDPADTFLCRVTNPNPKEKQPGPTQLVWIGQLLELRKTPKDDADSAVGFFHWFTTVPKKRVVYQPAFREPDDTDGGGNTDRMFYEVPADVNNADLDRWRYTTEWAFTADQLVITFDFDEVWEEGNPFPIYTIPDENRIQAVHRLISKGTSESPASGEATGQAEPKKRRIKAKSKPEKHQVRAPKRKAAAVFSLESWAKRRNTGAREPVPNRRYQS